MDIVVGDLAVPLLNILQSSRRLEKICAEVKKLKGEEEKNFELF